MTFEEWREKRGYQEPIRGGEEWHARDEEVDRLHAQVEAARRAVTAWAKELAEVKQQVSAEREVRLKAEAENSLLKAQINLYQQRHLMGIGGTV